VERSVRQARPSEFDALILPGGERHVRALQDSKDAMDFIRAFFVTGKPIGAISEGLHAVIEANLLFEPAAGFAARRGNARHPASHDGPDHGGTRLAGRVIRHAPEDDLPGFVTRMVAEIVNALPAPSEYSADSAPYVLTRPRLRSRWGGSTSMTLAQFVRRGLAHCRFVRSGSGNGAE
jgi:hypothetical protein